jgi:hypothetical protein
MVHPAYNNQRSTACFIKNPIVVEFKLLDGMEHDNFLIGYRNILTAMRKTLIVGSLLSTIHNRRSPDGSSVVVCCNPGWMRSLTDE